MTVLNVSWHESLPPPPLPPTANTQRPPTASARPLPLGRARRQKKHGSSRWLHISAVNQVGEIPRLDGTPESRAEGERRPTNTRSNLPSDASSPPPPNRKPHRAGRRSKSCEQVRARKSHHFSHNVGTLGFRRSRFIISRHF